MRWSDSESRWAVEVVDCRPSSFNKSEASASRTVFPLRSLGLARTTFSPTPLIRGKDEHGPRSDPLASSTKHKQRSPYFVGVDRGPSVFSATRCNGEIREGKGQRKRGRSGGPVAGDAKEGRGGEFGDEKRKRDVCARRRRRGVRSSFNLHSRRLLDASSIVAIDPTRLALPESNLSAYRPSTPSLPKVNTNKTKSPGFAKRSTKLTRTFTTTESPGTENVPPSRRNSPHYERSFGSLERRSRQSSRWGRQGSSL